MAALQDLNKAKGNLSELASGSDVVFGPQFSEIAERWLMDPEQYTLDHDVVLTTAATPRVREHEQIGIRLFQFAPNIDQYVEQMMLYFDRFSGVRPDKIGIFYRDDAYGKAAYRAIVRESTKYGWAIESQSFPANIAFEESSDSAVLESIIGEFISEGGVNSPYAISMIVDAGARLPEMLEHFNNLAPNSTIATPSSVPLENLSSNTKLKAIVPYSYYNGVYTLTTLEFLNASEIAEQILKLDGSFDFVGDFPKVNTVDAEDHDATLYWVRKNLPPSLDGRCDKNTGNMYVTNFRVRQQLGREFHEGNLFLFKLENGVAVPATIQSE